MQRIKTKEGLINFIGIGAQKSGTTWLYERLSELPQFTLTPVKEIHYFDRESRYPSPNVLSKTRLKDRLSDGKWLLRALGKPFLQLLRGNLHLFKWYLNYYYSTYNDKWYHSIFKNLKGIKGEITPSYAILKENDVKRLRKLAPEAKLIFLLRNPIERAWSHYRHEQRNKRNFNMRDLDMNDIKIFMNSPGQERRSNYSETIKVYERYFPPGQLLIGFYDAIIEDPEDMLEQIVTFLGGDASIINDYCKLGKVSNKSKPGRVPEVIEKFLAEKYHDQIEYLSKTYGGYFSKWYNETYRDVNNDNLKTRYKPTFIL